MNINWLLGSIFAAGFMGSFHCIGMCGGIVSCFSRRVSSFTAYQMGRVFMYGILGGVAGLLGGGALFNKNIWVLYATSVVFALLILWSGLSMIFPGKLNLHLKFLQNWNRKFQNFFSIILKKHSQSVLGSFLSGVCTGLLPCGYLHAFVLAAATTGGVLKGALTMAVFWLSTLPALSLVGLGVLGPYRSLLRKFPKVAGLLLVTIALMSLSQRWYIGKKSLLSSTETPSCHNVDKKLD